MPTNGTDRRFTPRMDLSLPIQFRPVLNTFSSEENARSVNISRRGVYVATSLPVTAGIAVELQFTMPERFSGKPRGPGVASAVLCASITTDFRAAAGEWESSSITTNSCH